MDLNEIAETPPWEWPEEVSEVLGDVLSDGEADLDERLLAADLSGEFSALTDDLVDVLLTVVGSPEEPEELRSRAAIALGPLLAYGAEEGFEGMEIAGVPVEPDTDINEESYHRACETLRRLFHDASVPEDVRRSVLEATVRSPEDWHQSAVRGAFHSGDRAWRLTGAFCMRYVKGFDEEIVQALDSGDKEILFHAVRAAGNWEVDAAWSRVVSFVETADSDSDRDLLLAAIEAVADIRPEEAPGVLGELLEHEDEDVVDAAFEAIHMADGYPEDDEEF